MMKRVNDRRATPERHLTGNELEYVSYQDLEFIKQIMPGNEKPKQRTVQLDKPPVKEPRSVQAASNYAK